jgi:aspartate aminotransferase
MTEWRFAKRLSDLKPSPILSMKSKSASLEDNKKRTTIHLEVGDPDFDTPEHIRSAAERAMNSGVTHYTAARGLPELREAVAASLKSDYGVDANPATDILISQGSKFAIYCFLMATVDSGDEVMIPEPFWPTYANSVRLCGGTPVTFPLREDDYGLDFDTLEGAFTQKTKVLMLNFPNNPTGGVMERKEVERLAQVLKDRDVVVLSDEVYGKFVYDGMQHACLLANPDLRDKAVMIDSFSKTYAMTGWRLGHTVGRKEIIDKMTLVQETSNTCAAPFVQKAGLAALTGPQTCVGEMRAEYDKRRHIVVDALSSVQQITCPTPKGGLYVFPKFNYIGLTSAQLADTLLVETGVATTPGSGFGRSGEGHLRISLTAPTEQIREGVERIRNLVKGG